MINKLKKLYETIIPSETRFHFYKLRHPLVYKELRQKVYSSPKGDFSLSPYDLNKVIFIHITKTAGTSVAKSLFNYMPYHYTATEYRVIFGKKDFNDYFKFAFVRNPWDRLYSSYRYLVAGGWNNEDKDWGEENIARFSDFNQFVVEWLSRENIKKHIHFKPQYEFVCDSNGNMLLDYLAYFETIEDDYNHVANRLNVDKPLGKHNMNPGKSYRDIYSEESKEIVRQIYQTDIEYFGYNFNGIDKRVSL